MFYVLISQSKEYKDEEELNLTSTLLPTLPEHRPQSVPTFQLCFMQVSLGYHITLQTRSEIEFVSRLLMSTPRILVAIVNRILGIGEIVKPI